MLCLREFILLIRKRQQKPTFYSLIIISIDKSFENSIENILNHPY
jgi:hypothetical protein